MATADVRKADERPRESGYYVAYRKHCCGAPDVCYFNSRDDKWNFQGYRVEVTHYLPEKLMERKHADG